MPPKRSSKFLAMVLVFALLSGFKEGAARARPSERREVTVEYEVFNAGSGGGPSGLIAAEATFDPGGARYLELEIDDQTGGGVLAKVFQDQEITTLCTSTPGPVMIRPGLSVTVRMYEGRCFDGTPSVVTSGTVTARLLDRIPKGPRVESRPYSASAPEVAGKDGDRVYVTAVTFPVGNRERRVSVEIEDVAGQPVFAKVEQGVGGFPSESGVEICGASSEPLRVRPGTSITVFIYAGGCPGVSASPTHGMVAATFL